MSKLYRSQTVSTSADNVWKQLADYEGIGKWNPNLNQSFLLNGSDKQGVGALRQCDLKDGKNWIRERVVEWKEGESYTVDIYEGTMPLKVAKATLGVKSLGNNQSEVFMEMEYTMKMGVVGAMMDVLMMRSMMKKNMDKVLSGLSTSARQAA